MGTARILGNDRLGWVCRNSCVLGFESGSAYASLALGVGAKTRRVLRLELGDVLFFY